ncbi:MULTISPECIES: ABC transporter ATP-binding protein [unclassified Corallococcus]|uniref:ABC transporter ATP-binding protein n=1 Tax=unclassified Corallococcus TaxID=2685029 RepID=UPI001A8ED23E|nr:MULTISPECIES: ABC transporter ATP-binding protein [unclassified Corallococcus]MBN9684522.1 ABC transporter ATP-binding protein [Corallococcus sp. NCSPR001]WAS84004.1 ABC transporter ATP-binding protein [Corallococcus sp. NCRR]
MTSALASPDAIVLRNVVKSFRKSTIRREYTTIKSELIRLLRGQRDTDGKSMIEALRGIDLVVPRGKTVGIIGRNGSGKSTLLKLISGIYTPTTGTIDINGRISALLDLGAGFHPDFSGRENILINGIILGMSRAEVKARMEEIIAFSELGDFIDEPVRTYSSGMYMRLAFSVATHVDPDILIIDEILAVGDEHFGKKSLAKMTEFKRAGKTIVIVTHDLGTLERWCDLGAWIDAGRIREFGPPADVIRSYRRAVELAEERGMSMESPALASDGGALPSLAAPQAEPSPLTVDAVTLKGRDGGAVEFVDTEDGLELSVAYTARTPAPELGLGLELCRVDGVLVHATDTFAEEVPFCAAASGSGTVRFVVDRLGLVAGRYTFTVVVRDRAGQVREKHEAACAFEVRSNVKDGGVTRPPHRWIVEGAAARVAPVRDVGS